MPKTIKTKRCPHCKQIFPRSKEYFYRNKTTKDGLRDDCKQCALQRSKQYHQNHKAERQQYSRQYAYDHKTERQQYEKTRKTQRRAISKKHRHTVRGHLNCVWYHMRGRCNNPEYNQYKNYGGRGVQIRFSSFEDFFYYVVKELKIDPRGLTIDRINNDGHYEKGNIRFISQSENSKRKKHFLSLS